MIFSKGYRITQEFGARPDYYKQFGFDGHEGLDVVPKVAGDTVIYCIEDGEVIRDVDNPKSGAYGEHVVVWNRNNRRAWWYCHLSSNTTNLGQMVRAGEVIGVMGATGNTQGAHLHLNVRKTDDKKNPIDQNNGYKGFVNPLPILQIINNPPMANTIQVDTKMYEKLVGNATAKKEVAEYLKIVNPDDASAEDMKRVIGGIQSLVTTAQNENASSKIELENIKEEISRLRESLAKSEASKDSLIRESKTLQDLLDKQGRDIGGLRKEKGELENQIKELKRGALVSLEPSDLLRMALLKFLKL